MQKSWIDDRPFFIFTALLFYARCTERIAEIAKLLLNGAIKARPAIRSCVTETSRRSKSRTLIRER